MSFTKPVSRSQKLFKLSDLLRRLKKRKLFKKEVEEKVDF